MSVWHYKFFTRLKKTVAIQWHRAHQQAINTAWSMTGREMSWEARARKGTQSPAADQTQPAVSTAQGSTKKGKAPPLDQGALSTQITGLNVQLKSDDFNHRGIAWNIIDSQVSEIKQGGAKPYSGTRIIYTYRHAPIKSNRDLDTLKIYLSFTL